MSNPDTFKNEEFRKNLEMTGKKKFMILCRNVWQICTGARETLVKQGLEHNGTQKN
jgi:hypothetical protein